MSNFRVEQGRIRLRYSFAGQALLQRFTIPALRFQMVNLGVRQGRRILATASVARLR